MNHYSKITPKWGKNIYGLWSCQSLQYQDPEKEKTVLAMSSNFKVYFKQIRKLNKITCMDCKHYYNGQCPFSNEIIQLTAKKYKSLKPKCSVCSLPLSFHHFLLEKNSDEKLCIMCSEAKIHGTLEEKKKKQKNSKKLQICELIFIIIFSMLTYMEVLFDGVTDGGDYFFFGFLGLIIIGIFSYYLIKRRKKKKIEEEN